MTHNMAFLLVYLHFTLAHSKVHSQGCFDWNISQTVTERANIAIDNQYEFEYDLSISILNLGGQDHENFFSKYF